MPTTITIPLLDHEAWALAQFVKRLSYREIRDNAVDEQETDNMKSAINNLQKSLAEAGFNPR